MDLFVIAMLTHNIFKTIDKIKLIQGFSYVVATLKYFRDVSKNFL